LLLDQFSDGLHAMDIFSAIAKIAILARGMFVRGRIRLHGGSCGQGLRVESGFRLRHGSHAGISIGKDVYIGMSTVFDCPSPGTLEIGNNVTLTHGVFISALDCVIIGDDSLIGEYVSIRDADHQAHVSPVPIRDQPMVPNKCILGTNVWIGRGAAILSGARLSDGCIVGANSVVKGAVVENSIVAGAPARTVGERHDPAISKKK
jgi:acetyltransferase-like isoleucine patch superfamily enzyme